MHALPHSGVNWANTARLFEDLGEEASSFTYEIYGFEASPLIAPFADAFFAWLNGKREAEPETCLPRSGSSPHLNQYATAYGCNPATSMEEDKLHEMRSCMFTKLAGHLDALRPSPRLNSSRLVSDRLDSARSQCRRAVKDQYTFIPAAAGSSLGTTAG